MIPVLLFGGAIVSLILGLVVFLQQPRQISIISFSLANIGAAIWAAGVAVFLLADSTTVMYGAAAVYYIAAASIACFMLLFALSFAAGKTVTVWRLVVAVVPFLIMAALLTFTPHVMLESVTKVASGNVVNLNIPAYLMYVVYYVVYFSLSLAVLVRRFRKATYALKKHYGYVLFAYGGAGLIGMSFNLILPSIGNYAFIWIGPLCLFLFAPIVSIAIARYGLFDVRRAAVRTVAYVLSLSMLALVYYVLAYVVSRFLIPHSAELSTGASARNIALALLLAFIFQPVKAFFDRITNNIFYRDNYDSEEFFGRVNRTLTSTTDLRVLLERVACEIADTLKSEQVFFFAYRMNNRHISAGTKGHGTLTMKEVDLLESAASAGDFKLLSVRAMPEGDEVQRMLEARSVALVLPLERDSQTIGYLALGDRRSGRYAPQDMRALEAIADSLVIAIQNTLSVQEVKDLNASLQQRIDDATKELRTSNEKLHRLDVAKDEFVSMASHQLRTPLTSVKGYISMVIEGDAGKISDMQAKLLGEAFTSSERMVHLINDFLNVSRLQTGKFMLDRRQVDLADVVQQEVDSLQTTAKARNIKLQYRQPSVFPVLYLDEGKLRQVIMNFIDNAFYYSREFSTVVVRAARDDGDVVVTVVDSGMGVPEVEQKRLFTKFFRATNARKQRPDGTGVGLFLAKKVILAHGGSMIFESVEGKGSTFGFRLPIKKLSLAPADDADQLDN